MMEKFISHTEGRMPEWAAQLPTLTANNISVYAEARSNTARIAFGFCFDGHPVSGHVAVAMTVQTARLLVDMLERTLLQAETAALGGDHAG